MFRLLSAAIAVVHVGGVFSVSAPSLEVSATDLCLFASCSSYNIGITHRPYTEYPYLYSQYMELK